MKVTSPFTFVCGHTNRPHRQDRMSETPPPSEPAARLKKRSLIVLLSTTIIFGLLIVPGVGVMIISPEAFHPADAPANPRLIAFVISLISFPVVAVISIVAAWVLYFKGRYRTAMWASLLPLLSLGAGLITFALVEAFPG
jgi:hypothetical protein